MIEIMKISGKEISANIRNNSSLFTPYEPIIKMLTDGVKVTGTCDNFLDFNDSEDNIEPTHKALLINIVAIKTEPTDYIFCRGCGDRYYYACKGLDCMNCGVNL